VTLHALLLSLVLCLTLPRVYAAEDFLRALFAGYAP
jgi:hypothetical protein